MSEIVAQGAPCKKQSHTLLVVSVVTLVATVGLFGTITELLIVLIFVAGTFFRGILMVALIGYLIRSSIDNNPLLLIAVIAAVGVALTARRF